MEIIPEPLIFNKDRLFILDQRKIPFKEKYFIARNFNDVKIAIKNMILRGAPLIGIAGAYGILLGIRKKFKLENFYKMKEELLLLRKTPYNLNYTLSILEGLIKKGAGYSDLEKEVENIFEREKLRCERVGENGFKVFKEKNHKRILTHCNTGKLATGGIGTALGVIYKSREIVEMVYVTETRPYFQGARLTSYELSKLNIPFKIILDAEAALLMKKGMVDAVIVGADRITMDGYLANKIGTLSIAISAKEFGIPFYVASPISTIDLSAKGEEGIKLEERSGDEVRGWGKTKWIPQNFDVMYYSFDLTPPFLIKMIITDMGNFSPQELETVQFRDEKRELF
ncbi:MAG: S-methyl-5-thioribose-1-phosphate isomerase [Candidatus Hydrothermales bacterium]